MPFGLISAGVSAVAGLIGGSSQRKAEKRQQQRDQAFSREQYETERADAIEDQINSLPRLRESAEKAGFNPLSALATGGGGFGQTGARMGAVAGRAAPLASGAILANAVSGIADAWTSKLADDANRSKVEAEIWRRQVEKERAGGAGDTIRRTVRTAGVADLGNRPAVGTAISVTPGLSGPAWNVLSSVGGTPATELKMPENVTREHIGPLWQSVTRKDGSILEYPVLADPEEIIAGYAGHVGPEVYADQKSKWDNWSEYAPIRLGVEAFTAAKKADSFIRYLGGNLIASPNSDGRMTVEERRDMMKKYRGNTGVYNKGNY